MNTELLFLALVIVVWWMGVWGLLDTLLHLFIRGNTVRAIVLYSLMIVAVLVFVSIRPDVLERFV